MVNQGPCQFARRPLTRWQCIAVGRPLALSAARRAPASAASPKHQTGCLITRLWAIYLGRRAAWPMAGTRRRWTASLERVGVRLTGADANRLLDRRHKDLAVADLPGLGGRADGFDRLLGEIGGDSDLEPDLGQEVHGIFGAAIDFHMALLAAVAFDLGHGHAVHPDRGQRVTHLLELERLDDGDDELHGAVPGSWVFDINVQSARDDIGIRQNCPAE